MSPASRSVLYFGYYLVITGVALIGIPNIFLSTFQIAETQEIWIRVVGVVVLNIGITYILMAPTNHTLFFTISAYTRATVFGWFLIFAFAGWAPMQLILFGAIDLAGAVWTFTVLKRS